MKFLIEKKNYLRQVHKFWWSNLFLTITYLGFLFWVFFLSVGMWTTVVYFWLINKYWIKTEMMDFCLFGWLHKKKKLVEFVILLYSVLFLKTFSGILILDPGPKSIYRHMKIAKILHSALYRRPASNSLGFAHYANELISNFPTIVL